jgi:hypothetical protein
MKSCSTALANYLAAISENTETSNDIYVCDLYTFTQLNGVTINLCSGPIDITYNSVTYSSLAPGIAISRSAIRQSVGLKVDNLKITLEALPDYQPITTVPFLQELCAGYWDGATVTVQRLFGRYWGDLSLAPPITWWKGIVGELSSLDRSKVEIEVPSKLELLNQPLPRNLFSSLCNHVLYDAGCTLSASSFTSTGVVQSGSNASAIVTNLTQPANFPGPTAAPTFATYKPSPGPNLPERILFVVQTYVSALGESLVGPEATGSFGVLTNVYITNPGNGYTPGTSLTLAFSGGGGSGAAGHVSVSNTGALAVVTITSAGSNYTSAPTVTVTGGGGSNGTLVAVIAGIPGNELLVVNSPASASSVTGWNCYIGYASGAEYLQTAIPLNIGTNFLEPITGIVQGNTPPITATNGYFSQGVLTFTSGVNNGLSRLVQTYTNNGSNNVCNVIPPFPQAPSPGDTFSVVAGCDRRLSTCVAKFNNESHFMGFPFIPIPESAL